VSSFDEAKDLFTALAERVGGNLRVRPLDDDVAQLGVFWDVGGRKCGILLTPGVFEGVRRPDLWSLHIYSWRDETRRPKWTWMPMEGVSLERIVPRLKGLLDEGARRLTSLADDDLQIGHVVASDLRAAVLEVKDGWASFTLSLYVDSHAFDVSDAGEPLHQLVYAMRDALTGKEGVSSWQEEPGEVVFTFAPQEKGHVMLTCRRDDAVVFSHEVPPHVLLRAVGALLIGVRERMASSPDAWRTEDFPQKEWADVERLWVKVFG